MVYLCLGMCSSDFVMINYIFVYCDKVKLFLKCHEGM
jgi:hypothetical protein